MRLDLVENALLSICMCTAYAMHRINEDHSAIKFIHLNLYYSKYWSLFKDNDDAIGTSRKKGEKENRKKYSFISIPFLHPLRP